MSGTGISAYVPPPPDTRSLLERVVAIWNKPFKSLPIGKDLPRLVMGFEIVNGDTKGVIYKERGDQKTVICRDIIKTMAIFFPDYSDKEAGKRRTQTKLQKREKVRSKASEDAHAERDIGEDHSDGDDDCDDFGSRKKSSKNSEDEELQFNNFDLHDDFDTENVFANFLINNYPKYVKSDSGDLGVMMSAFLFSGVIDEQGKLAKLLKCIQQEIILPPVMDLRMKVYEEGKFKYKDVKGTWYVRIELYFEDGECESTEMAPATPTRRRRKSVLHNTEIKSIVLSPAPLGRRKKSLNDDDDPTTPKTPQREREREKDREDRPERPVLDKKFNRTHSLPAFEVQAIHEKRKGKPIIMNNDDRDCPIIGSPPVSPTILSSPLSPLSTASGSFIRFLPESPHKPHGLKRSSPRKESKSDLRSSFNSSGFLEKLSAAASESSSDNKELFKSEKIKFRPVKKVRIVHRKREQSEDTTAPNNSYFEFEWEFAITFSPEIEILDVSLQLVDVSTGEDFPKEKHEQLLNVLKDFMSEEFPFVSIWKKPAPKSFHKECKSIAKVLQVTDQQRKLLFSGLGDKLDAHRMVIILLQLLKDRVSISGYETRFLSKPKASKSLKSFIQALTVATDDEVILLRLLKACSKNMVVPASSKIKNSLKVLFKEIKDNRGNNKITVCTLDNIICVSHSQQNICIAPAQSESIGDIIFTLYWEVALYFTANIDKLLNVQIKILEYSFSNNTNDLFKHQILQTLNPYLSAETIETKASSIPASVVIHCLKTSLSRLPPDKLIVNDSSLPGGSMSALELLELLHSSLKIQNFDSIPFTECKQINPQ